MPRGDRTGPEGRGPMTGRGMGYCAGNNVPGCQNPCFGRGMRRGSGRAFGRRFWTTPQELTAIWEISEKETLEELKAEKKEIDKAIKDLEQKNKQKK